MKLLYITLLFSILIACDQSEKVTTDTTSIDMKIYADITVIQQYSTFDFKRHLHLKGKKIFIDPGHGGAGTKDIFRTGPTGLTEEQINLKASLLLAQMLTLAGAEVQLSRTDNSVLDLDSRVKLVKEFEPELFLSVHHNGSLRSIDAINYPCVLFWGNKDNNPAGYDFARILNNSVSKTINVKGHIFSDYAIFWESGTKVLRKTRDICPGALVEFGFFSDEAFEKKLKEFSFNVKEAESYFEAISEYFKRGVPKAAVFKTTPNKLVDSRYSFLTKRNTKLYIKVDGQTTTKGIKEGSLSVVINKQQVEYKKISHDTYQLLFGSKLSPGEYRIQFSFHNHQNQSSMLFMSKFSVGLKPGEFDVITKQAFTDIENKKYQKGLVVLLPLYHYCTLEPLADKIAFYIAQAFEQTGNLKSAAFYYNKVYHFYPDSEYRAKITHAYLTDSHFKIDNYGKRVAMKFRATEYDVVRSRIKD